MLYHPPATNLFSLLLLAATLWAPWAWAGGSVGLKEEAPSAPASGRPQNPGPELGGAALSLPDLALPGDILRCVTGASIAMAQKSPLPLRRTQPDPQTSKGHSHRVFHALPGLQKIMETSGANG